MAQQLGRLHGQHASNADHQRRHSRAVRADFYPEACHRCQETRTSIVRTA